MSSSSGKSFIPFKLIISSDPIVENFAFSPLYIQIISGVSGRIRSQFIKIYEDVLSEVLIELSSDYWNITSLYLAAKTVTSMSSAIRCFGKPERFDLEQVLMLPVLKDKLDVDVFISNRSCTPVVLLVLSPPIRNLKAFREEIEFFSHDVVGGFKVSFSLSFSPAVHGVVVVDAWIDALRLVESESFVPDEGFKGKEVGRNGFDALSKFNDTELVEVFVAIASNSNLIELVVEEQMSSVEVGRGIVEQPVKDGFFCSAPFESLRVNCESNVVIKRSNLS